MKTNRNLFRACLALSLAAGSVACGSSDTTTGQGSTSGSGDPSTNPSSGVQPPAGYGVQADDLAAPDPADGMQFATPDGAFTVNPGQEIFPNLCVTVPNDISIGGFQSWMTDASSHHFILYKGGAAPANGACTVGRGQWLYASSTPGEVVRENLPDGVGLQIAANTQLILNMHFINTGNTPLQPQIKVNLMYAQNVQYAAGTLVSFNTGIDVPAHGSQTVSGTCTAPAGSNFFLMSTHTHKNATLAKVTFTTGGQTQEIVHTGAPADGQSLPADQVVGSGTDWEHPGIGYWTAPNFLTTQAGDSFGYSCSYQNDGDTPIFVGETAGSNEMCMAVGYYFPAGSAACH